MRLAVISDVHANIEALEAVLRHSEGAGADGWICLGDTIGYGADPEAVVNTLSKGKIESVMGNHELALLKPEALKQFNSKARHALLINKRMLSKKARAVIGCFNTNIVKFGACFVHGIPPDSATRYLSLVPENALESILSSLPQKLAFVGHTHRLGVVRLKGGEITRKEFSKDVESLEKGSRYIINAGSVGQPRDGGVKATYVIWDLKKAVVEKKSVTYNRKLAAWKIIRAGISKRYAARLSGTI